MKASVLIINNVPAPYIDLSAGERYWPIRPICEAVGLKWHSQIPKINSYQYLPKEIDLLIPGQKKQKP